MRFWSLFYLDTNRALSRLQDELFGDVSSAPRPAKLHKHKIRLSRKRIVESAMKVLEVYGSKRGLLEVEFFGEVGTGQGPTAEFYSLVSRQLQKKKFRLFRDADNDVLSSDSLDKSPSIPISREFSSMEPNTPLSPLPTPFDSIPPPLSFFPFSRVRWGRDGWG